MLIRYSHAAGNKLFIFFSTFDDVKNFLSRLPPKTSVIVFHDRQLPLRGVVNKQLISEALNLLKDGEEYLIAGLNDDEHGNHLFLAGESHEELRGDLTAELNKHVAIGKYPPWMEKNERVISAVVPSSDGKVEKGVY